MKEAHANGKVFLVGAGPGDPDLITVKGAQALALADVVVRDRLVHPRLLDLAPDSAEHILVGKRGGYYSFPQSKINELLAQRAGAGKIVVRLKGGDPYLFGRGSEEALFLLERKIPFEVVPGVTSALAAPAAAGIPLTQRSLSSSVAIVTGNQAADATSAIRWDLLAQAVDTLVVMMPLTRLREIVARLVLHGRSLATPAAVIEAATWDKQRQVVSDLARIANDAEGSGIGSPAVLVVGQSAQLASVLKGLTYPGHAPTQEVLPPTVLAADTRMGTC